MTWIIPIIPLLLAIAVVAWAILRPRPVPVAVDCEVTCMLKDETNV